jgi:hypothetical protein
MDTQETVKQKNVLKKLEDLQAVSPDFKCEYEIESPKSSLLAKQHLANLEGASKGHSVVIDSPFIGGTENVSQASIIRKGRFPPDTEVTAQNDQDANSLVG